MPMRQLRRCDFCGGDAAGVYEVLPPEVSPTEAEQQRLMLCSDCAGTLETVIDPLLERLGVETGGETSTAGGATMGSSDPEDRPEAPEPQNREAADVDSADTGTVSETTSSQAGGSGSDDFNGASASERADQPQTDDAAFGAEPDPGPIEWGTSGPDSDTTEEPAATDGAAGTEADDGGADAADTADATAVDPDGNEGETDAAGGDGVGEEPEEFRTVMRLLGNREFPVDRGAIVELAASAYELDEQHVHHVLDYAVDRGVIAEDGHTLRRD